MRSGDVSCQGWWARKKREGGEGGGLFGGVWMLRRKLTSPIDVELLACASRSPSTEAADPMFISPIGYS